MERVGSINMKEEYDCSHAEQGKFYRQDNVFQLPIYLEPEVESFVMKLAKEHKKTSVKL